MSDIRQRKSYEFEDSYSIRKSGGDPTGNADFLHQQFLRKQRELNATINVEHTSDLINKPDDLNAEMSTVQTASEKLAKQDLHQWLKATHQLWAQIVFRHEIEQAKNQVKEKYKDQESKINAKITEHKELIGKLNKDIEKTIYLADKTFKILAVNKAFVSEFNNLCSQIKEARSELSRKFGALARQELEKRLEFERIDEMFGTMYSPQYVKEPLNEHAKPETLDKIPEYANWLHNQAGREQQRLQELSALNQTSDETLSKQNYEWLINQECQNQWHKWHKWREFSTLKHWIKQQIEHEQREMPNKLKELEDSGYLTFEHLEPDLQEQLEIQPDKKYRILTEHFERKLQGNRLKIREEFQKKIKTLEADGYLTFGHLEPDLQEQLRAWPNFETYTKYNILTEKAKSLSDEDKRTFKERLEEWTSTTQHRQLVKEHEQLLKIIRNLQGLNPVQQLKEAGYLQYFDSLEAKQLFDKRSDAIRQFHAAQAWLDKSPENIDDLLPPSLYGYHQTYKTWLKNCEDLYKELMRQLDLQNHEQKSPTNMAPTGPLNRTNKELDKVIKEFTKSVKHLTVRQKVIEKCMNILEKRFNASQDRFQRIIEKSNEFNNFTEELKQAAITDYDYTSNQFKQLIKKVKTTSGAQRNNYYKSADKILCELEDQEQNIVSKINEHWYKKVLPIYQSASAKATFIYKHRKYMSFQKGDDFNLAFLSLAPVAYEALQAFDDQKALDNLQTLASTINTMTKELQDWCDQFSSIQKKIDADIHDIKFYKEYLSQSKQDEYNALLPDFKNTVERGKKSLGDGPDFEAFKTVAAKLGKIAEEAKNVHAFRSWQWQRSLLRP